MAMQATQWSAMCRLAQRWGMTNGRTVEQTEADLKLLWPEAWPVVSCAMACASSCAQQCFIYGQRGAASEKGRSSAATFRKHFSRWCCLPCQPHTGWLSCDQGKRLHRLLCLMVWGNKQAVFEVALPAMSAIHRVAEL